MNTNAAAALPDQSTSTSTENGSTVETSAGPVTSPKTAASAFAGLGLNEQLVAVVDQLGFKTPTPIQTKAIPAVLGRRDVVGLAQTGTGKTAAFVLPILHRLLEQTSNTGTLRALIVVPTRELAAQVLEAVRSFSRGTGLRAISVYGGVRIQNQKNDLRRPLDIIVGCPGRLLDLLNQRSFSLDKIQFLVLDEADQMFDMGFIDPIRKLLRACPKQRQSLLFSATMPEEIATLTREALTDPVKVQVAETSSPSTLNHIAYPVVAHLKSQLLTHLLKEFASESVLVFTRTKHKAKKLARVLEKAGLKATSLQGNLSQSQRMEAMKGFRSGKYSVMVATDIAARGIDVASISHVVNFDFPLTTETYLHRVGRTGRALRSGDALSFVTRDDESQMRRVERSLRLNVIVKKAEGFDYNAKPEVNEMNDGSDDRDDRSRFSRHRSTHTSHSPASSSYRGNRSSSSRGYSDDRGPRSGGYAPRGPSSDSRHSEQRSAAPTGQSATAGSDRGERGGYSPRGSSAEGAGRYNDRRSNNSGYQGNSGSRGGSGYRGNSGSQGGYRGGQASRGPSSEGNGYAPRSNDRSGNSAGRGGERSDYNPRGSSADTNGRSSDQRTSGYAPRSNYRGGNAGGESRGPSNYRGNAGGSSRSSNGGGSRYGNSSSNSSSRPQRPQRSNFRSDRSRSSSESSGPSRDR